MAEHFHATERLSQAPRQCCHQRPSSSFLPFSSSSFLVHFLPRLSLYFLPSISQSTHPSFFFHNVFRSHRLPSTGKLFSHDEDDQAREAIPQGTSVRPTLFIPTLTRHSAGHSRLVCHPHRITSINNPQTIFPHLPEFILNVCTSPTSFHSSLHILSSLP